MNDTFVYFSILYFTSFVFSIVCCRVGLVARCKGVWHECTGGDLFLSNQVAIKTPMYVILKVQYLNRAAASDLGNSHWLTVSVGLYN